MGRTVEHATANTIILTPFLLANTGCHFKYHHPNFSLPYKYSTKQQIQSFLLILTLQIQHSMVNVLDLVSQIRDVVLVRRIFSSGKPQGVRILEWKGMGRGWKWGDQFRSNLGPRWTGSYHIKEGFQVSKRKWKRSKRESERGSKEQGDCAIIVLSIICMYIIITCNCLNAECS